MMNNTFLILNYIKDNTLYYQIEDNENIKDCTIQINKEGIFHYNFLYKKQIDKFVYDKAIFLRINNYILIQDRFIPLISIVNGKPKIIDNTLLHYSSKIIKAIEYYKCLFDEELNVELFGSYYITANAFSLKKIIVFHLDLLNTPSLLIYRYLFHEFAHQKIGNDWVFIGEKKHIMEEAIVEFLQICFVCDLVNDKNKYLSEIINFHKSLYFFGMHSENEIDKNFLMESNILILQMINLIKVEFKQVKVFLDRLSFYKKIDFTIFKKVLSSFK